MNYAGYLSRAAGTMQESAIRKMGAVSTGIPDVISFAPGYPAPDTFPWEDFREITHELLAARHATTLQYGPTRGFRPLLDAIAGVLRGRGIDASPEELLVTTGSQQGLDLVARVLLDPGDVALVELPAYTGAITAFRNVQAELAGVRQEADGIDLDDLDRVMARLRADGKRVRFLYVVPNFQNPTGLLLAREKRHRLLEAAHRHDILLVEDDPYGELYFTDVADESDTRPIKADDHEGRVLYLSSFSKTLAPGYRVAWIAAPSALTAKFEVAKQAADICTGALDQRVVWQAIARGVLAAQGPRLRAVYQHKRTVMERALRRHAGDLLTWPEPRGGFFIWITAPPSVDSAALLARAMQHRVLFVVGSAFFVDGTGANTLRLAFSAPTPERIDEGVRRLSAALHEELEHRHQGVGSAGTGSTGPGGASRGTVTPIG
jgi:2-aminoadipate transaminase